MRPGVRPALSLVVTALVLSSAAPCAAQSFGIGGRIAMVRSDVAGDDDAVRFTGGQIRLGLGQRAALEVSVDRHTESLDLLNERVKETPVQASLMLFLAGGGFRPFVLGGPGWYSRSVEAIDDPDGLIVDVSTREFGWHAGFGAEIRLGRHAGLHGDYRYTFLDFNGDEDEPAAATGRDSFISGLLPSYDGSMWTVGLTIYF
jgi:Outer membrane protein beta-barrel domain